MKRTPCLSFFLLILGAAILSAGLIALLTTRVAAYVEQRFGPPHSQLSLQQRWLYTWRLFLNEDGLLQPADPQGQPRPFEIKLGESTYSIAERLEKEGFVRNADLFRLYLLYAGLDTSIQAGRYTLSSRMTALEIGRALQDATPNEVDFYILPGWRLEEIAAALPTSGLKISPQAFLNYATAPSSTLPLISKLPSGVTLEGFLFPDKYQFSRQITVHEFVVALLKRFQANLDDDLLSAWEQQGLDLYQAVTLASIVQREAVISEEMPLIASVYLNRLRVGMRLDADPTVQYALGFQNQRKTWWKSPLSLEDLKVNSPYNTYLHRGLPPGPICNPGLQALRAVAFPTESSYLYFRAACDGSGRHLFAKTFEEHLRNACP